MQQRFGPGPRQRKELSALIEFEQEFGPGFSYHCFHVWENNKIFKLNDPLDTIVDPV